MNNKQLKIKNNNNIYIIFNNFYNNKLINMRFNQIIFKKN